MHDFLFIHICMIIVGGSLKTNGIAKKATACFFVIAVRAYDNKYTWNVTEYSK